MIVMETEDHREELQSLMIEAEQYKRRMDSIRAQMQIFDTSAEELHNSMSALTALEENKAGTGILVSIGSGSFIRAQLKDPEKVIVGVGSSLSMEKSIPDAKKFLEERLKEVSEAQEKMRKAAAETTEAIQSLDDEYRHVVSHMQEENRIDKERKNV